MNKITLISYPNYYYNSSTKLLFINLTAEERLKVQEWLKNNDMEISIFIYSNDNQIEWLLNVINIADSVYINVDNSTDISYYYISYIVNQSNVTWYSEDKDYSILNKDKTRDINEYLEKQ